MTRISIESLTDQHDVLFAMLVEFDRVLEEHGLNYRLAYGTALGAVRDGDIIEWDRDLDVHVDIADMPRIASALRTDLNADYEFQDAGEGDNQQFVPRVSLRGIHHSIVHLDIFPLAPASRFRTVNRTRVLLSRLISAMLTVRCAKPSEQYSHKALKRVVSTLAGPVLRLAPAAFYFALLAWVSEFAPLRSSAVLVSIAGSYGARELIPRESIEPPAVASVRGRVFPIPGRAEAYLTHMYGDFRTPPPPEVRSREVAYFDRFVLPRIQAAQQQ